MPKIRSIHKIQLYMKNHYKTIKIRQQQNKRTNKILTVEGYKRAEDI